MAPSIQFTQEQLNISQETHTNGPIVKEPHRELDVYNDLETIKDLICEKIPTPVPPRFQKKIFASCTIYFPQDHEYCFIAGKQHKHTKTYCTMYD